jgi:hypothetical protein
VVVVSDVVGDRGDLRLETRPTLQSERKRRITSAPSGYGQMLWIISMANPRKAPPMAQITASPSAPRMRRRHSFMGISCLPVK